MVEYVIYVPDQVGDPWFGFFQMMEGEEDSGETLEQITPILGKLEAEKYANFLEAELLTVEEAIEVEKIRGL